MKSPQTPLSVTAEPAALLPCPCCGGQAEIRVEPQYGKALAACCVNVLTCGMRGAWVTLRQDAAEAWNRRADAIAVAEPPIVWRCFHCNFVARTRDEGIEHFGFGMNESPPKCVAAAALAKPTAPINVAAQEPIPARIGHDPGEPEVRPTPVAATPNEPTAEGALALREAFIERFKLHDWPLHADGSFWGTVQYQWEGWQAALASVHPVPAPAAICGHGNGNPNNCPECRPERFPGEPSHWPALVRRLESLEAVLRADKLWAPVVRSEALNVVRQTIAARAHPVAPAPSADS